jgi:hypothetical protein
VSKPQHDFLTPPGHNVRGDNVITYCPVGCPAHEVWCAEEVVLKPEACPECKAGKHPNCDGTAWDFDTDRPTECPCALAGHAT